jgi:hypothetical protein
MNRCFVLLICLLQFINAGGQTSHLPSYPKGYFRNPLSIPMELSANFGELRPNHWHMGLDIRTDGRENLPVYAAADGYIAFVGVRPSSFGRFIIINHPNGLSTLYAHLNDFYPELERYVTTKQYEKESWAVELTFTPDQFRLQKGDFIAYSGNTGGSQGPHLHFEIFDTKTTKRFNPLLFGFPLWDNTPPTLQRLAMYDRSKSLYEQSPQFFSLKKTDSGYILPKNQLITTGLSKVSFALQMYDKLHSGASEDGVYAAKLFADSVPQVAFMLDSIDYDETVYINAHIDYRHDFKGGAGLQHIARMPGHQGAEYKMINGDGIINLADTNIHNIRIDVQDAYNNMSQLNFTIRHNDSLATLLPERIDMDRMAPNKVNVIEKNDFEMYMPEVCLYDSVPAYYYRNSNAAYNAITAQHQVNDLSYPVHGDITVKIKPDKAIPAEWNDKLVMLKNGRGNVIRKTTLNSGWLTAKYSDFGTFQVFADITPPSINELGKGDTVNLSNASRIVFTPTDNFGVKNLRVVIYSCMADSNGYHCTPDSLSKGQWLRFTNDKIRNWIYKFDERCPYGYYKLVATAEDVVGNKTTKEWFFKRMPYTPPPPKKKIVKKEADKKKTPAKKKEEEKKKTEEKKKESDKKKKEADKKKPAATTKPASTTTKKTTVKKKN